MAELRAGAAPESGMTTTLGATTPGAATPGLAPPRDAKPVRAWPVPGDGRPAVKGAIGPNKLAYSDGRFSLEGAYRTTRKGARHPHKGIDLPGAIGDPVRAAADGVVVTVTAQREKIIVRDPKTKKKIEVAGPRLAGWGNYVVVQHPDGYRTVYAHLETRPAIKVGTRVGRGEEIGRLGITGNARGQGSHVHFEVWNSAESAAKTKRKEVDPVKWMNGQLPGQ